MAPALRVVIIDAGDSSLVAQAACARGAPPPTRHVAVPWSLPTSSQRPLPTPWPMSPPLPQPASGQRCISLIGAPVALFLQRAVPRPAAPRARRSRSVPRGHAARLLLLGAALLWLGGCSEVSYYWQAAMGQWDILAARRPIAQVLADPAVGEPVKAQLRAVQEAQGFAGQALALPPEGHYTTYVDLHRDAVTWLVVASEPFALRAYRNCYLVVGCLDYRGYFRRDAARDFARQLSDQGYDVLVRPVQAYSTLGWFDDPLLNTQLRGDEADLVASVFHEQAHRLLFLKGDTGFNESFATFVEDEGLRRFLARQRRDAPRLLARYREVRADRARFEAILLRGRARLEALYNSGRPTAELRAEKQRLFQLLREDYQNQADSFKILDYGAWFRQELNNAHLVGVAQYHDLVPAFRALFRREDEDFLRFYAAVRALMARDVAARRNALEALAREAAPPAPDGTPAADPRAAPAGN